MKNAQNIALGADIGGSHITCQLFDLITQKPLEETWYRLPVDSRAPKEVILSAWVAAIRESTKDYEMQTLKGIGFAMPGPFNYPEGIALFKGVQKFDDLYGVNIRQNIQKRLSLSSSFPVRFLNDAASFAIGEAWTGSAKKHNRILAITLGTGFGTTFIKDGLPVLGKDGVPDDGFLYHIPYKLGIADDYFSTRWFKEQYYGSTARQIEGVKELADKVKEEKIAADIFSEFGVNLGEFLSPWVKKFNAQCVVLGGNISKSLELFKSEMFKEFKKDGLSPEVYLSTLEEKANIYGSAKLAEDYFYSNLMKSYN